MRVSVVAGLIVGVHVVVIGSVALQGCTNTNRTAGSVVPSVVEPPPQPILPPSTTVTTLPAQPVVFPPSAVKPPVAPDPVATSISAQNIYVVQKGDVLSIIAQKHGVRTAELQELNNLSNPNKIVVGQKILLPDYAKPSLAVPSATAKAESAKPAAQAEGGVYVVKSGDALSKIAVAHGVKTKDLMAANHLTDANKIRIGQKLVIPGAKASAPVAEKKVVNSAAVPSAAPSVTPAAAPVVVEEVAVVSTIRPVSVEDMEDQEAMLDYTVQEGDTADAIARLFVVRKDDILRVNNIPVGADVRPGQSIKIPPSSL
ncbi:MAG: LysM peptidoglycan-binding domain-containing protein [Verrucomicrobiota bacterium]|jgi:LysM repeat protein|nr:LysM peptidoglycan-binding domain-containing protein [Verrucomicrobiota bacterium]